MAQPLQIQGRDCFQAGAGARRKSGRAVSLCGSCVGCGAKGKGGKGKKRKGREGRGELFS